jgi:hypothetical protein
MTIETTISYNTDHRDDANVTRPGAGRAACHICAASAVITDERHRSARPGGETGEENELMKSLRSKSALLVEDGGP